MLSRRPHPSAAAQDRHRRPQRQPKAATGPIYRNRARTVASHGPHPLFQPQGRSASVDSGLGNPCLRRCQQSGIGFNHGRVARTRRWGYNGLASGRSAVGSAPRSGRGGRWFESSRPDHFSLVPENPLYDGIVVGAKPVNRLPLWWRMGRDGDQRPQKDSELVKAAADPWYLLQCV